MNPFPGQSPVTVDTSGTGSPGVIVSSGSGDAHGSWPTPLEAVGNDARIAANLMTAVESLTDRTNWNVWRTVDWIAGGDYRSLYKSQVYVANSVTIDRSAFSGAVSALIVAGDATGNFAIQAFASNNGTALQATGSGSGAAASFLGGSTGGGGAAQAGGGNALGWEGLGSGDGPGLRGVPGVDFGTPAEWANGGPVFVDTNIGSPSLDPGANCLWAEMIPKAQVDVTYTGSNGAQTVNAGVNVASVHVNSNGTSAAFVTVNFVRPMADTYYHVDLTPSAAAGSGPNLICNLDRFTDHFTFQTMAIAISVSAVGAALVETYASAGGNTICVRGKM